MQQVFPKITDSKKKEILAFLESSIQEKVQLNAGKLRGPHSYFLSVVLFETQAMMQKVKERADQHLREEEEAEQEEQQRIEEEERQRIE